MFGTNTAWHLNCFTLCNFVLPTLMTKILKTNTHANSTLALWGYSIALLPQTSCFPLASIVKEKSVQYLILFKIV